MPITKTRVRPLVVLAVLAVVLAVPVTANADDHISSGCQAAITGDYNQRYHESSGSFYAGETVTVNAEPIGGFVPLRYAMLVTQTGLNHIPDDTDPIEVEVTVVADGNVVGWELINAINGDPELADWTVRCVPAPPLDADQDGVPDSEDLCEDTDLAGDSAPGGLKTNRLWTDGDGNWVFGDDTSSGYTIADTGGCSASQLIAAGGLGNGHLRFGVSLSALGAFMEGLDG